MVAKIPGPEKPDLPPGIAEARQEVDRIDAEIVRLLSIRLSVVMRMAQIKRAVGLAFRDEDREDEILDNAAERAKALDLPRKQVRKIFRQIIRISLKAQN